MTRYFKVLGWVAVGIVALTAAQYGSVHLLTGRPSSWLFEASLDLGPPLLFAGDMVQLSLNHGSQAPLRDQPRAVAAGVLANICLYGAIALIVTWLFSPRRRSPARVVQIDQSRTGTGGLNAAKRTKSPPRLRR
jgi:hypothetical protein